MAISLKAYDSNIRVCLLYEPSAIKNLSKQELDFFDLLIKVDGADYTIGETKQYQRVKLLAYKYTPFDFTMYMDVDGIWHPAKKPSWFLGEVINNEFSIGMNGEYNVKMKTKSKPGYTYWGDVDVICKYWKIKNILPQTVSGFFSFHKTQNVEQLFKTALMVYDDTLAPTTQWANGKADEYCFNVAMGLLQMRQDPFHVFYFDKLNGVKQESEIYNNYWGLAIGGNKVSQNVVILYNRLVNKFSIIKGMASRHYHIDKIDIIPERKKF